VRRRYGQLLQPFVIEVQNTGGTPLQVGLLHRTAAHAALDRQVTSHAHATPQLTSPPHARLPVQLTVHAPVPHVTELPHDPLPLQVTLHVPVPHVTWLLHDALPPQVTLHAPRPHATVLQVPRALHAIVHDVALPQLTPLLHWLATEQPTSQIQPAGQVIAWLQAPLLSEQSIVQVFVALLHDVHCDGHTAASPSGGSASITPESAAITQNPSTQVRPSAQR
jgi:hypothetical protein